MAFNENTRVKISAILHLCRLGYEYLSHSNTKCDAFLQCSGSRIYSSRKPSDTIATIAGVFADSYYIIYPSKVAINGVDLVRKGSETSYLLYDRTVLTASQMLWNVDGYDRGTFVDTVGNLSFVDIAAKNTIDTVSKSSGFTVNFQGTTFGELTAAAKFDYGYNYALLDTASANNGVGNITKPLSDQAKAVFSQSDLNNFTSNRYIVVSITNYDYHIKLSSGGRKVGVFTSRTSQIPFFLKD